MDAMPGRVWYALVLALALLPACRDSTGPRTDGTAPEVRIAAPAEGALLDADSLAVSATVSDDRRVARVTYALNDGDEQEVAAPDGASAMVEFTVRGAGLGGNLLAVYAYDAAGNRGRGSVAFTVRDAVPPTVRVDAPGEGELAGRDSVVVAGVAGDDRQVARVTYSLDEGAEQEVAVQPGREVAFRAVLKGLSPGPHRVAVAAYDAGGNRASLVRAFTVAAVEVRITSPAAHAAIDRHVFPYRGEVHPAMPPGAGLVFTVNGGPIRVVCSKPRATCHFPEGQAATFEFTADGLPRGEAVVAVWVLLPSGERIGKAERSLTVSVPFRRYDVVPLGTTGRGTDLNEKGQVVGWRVEGESVRRAFFWEDGRLTDLGAGLGSGSLATGINESGEVVGTFTADCGRSFYWRAGGAAPPREPEGWRCGLQAVDVNDAGKVLVNDWGGTPRAMLFSGGAFTPLRGVFHSPFDPVGVSRGLLLTDQDRVVGFTEFQVTYSWGRLFTDREPVVLDAFTTLPVGMNDRGEVVAVCTGRHGSFCDGYLWTDGRRTPLPTLGYPAYGRPGGINGRGQVAGVFPFAETAPYAFTMRPYVLEDGTMYSVELSDAAWEVSGVDAVNDAGVILAYGRNRDTGAHGPLLLTPAP